MMNSNKEDVIICVGFSSVGFDVRVSSGPDNIFVSVFLVALTDFCFYLLVFF